MGLDPVHSNVRLAERIAALVQTKVIPSLKPGDRLPTLRVLAKQLDVSVSTIQSALAVLRQQGVVESWQGSGVYVAERKGKPRIGIVSEMDLMNPLAYGFFTKLVWHLRTFFREQEVQSLLYLGDKQPAGGDRDDEFTCWALLDDLGARRLDGVIALQPDCSLRYRPVVEKQGLPLVVTFFEPGYAHCIVPDMAKVVRDAVHELVRHGCHRVAYLGWDPEVAVRLRDSGLPIREGWVRDSLHPDLDGAGWEEFREIWTAYPEKPDGLLVGDDVLSQTAVRAIQELGIRVPEQLRVVVAGNRGSGIRYPFPVTVLELDPAEMAQRMGKMMLRLLRHEPVAEPHIRVPYRLATEPAQHPVVGKPEESVARDQSGVGPVSSSR